jgi:hypothetical protein
LVAGPRCEPDTKTDWPTDRQSQNDLNLCEVVTGRSFSSRYWTEMQKASFLAALRVVRQSSSGRNN